MTTTDTPRPGTLIVRYGDEVAWLDPMESPARFAERLARVEALLNRIKEDAARHRERTMEDREGEPP